MSEAISALILLLLAFLLSLPVEATPRYATWQAATTDTAGKPLPGDQQVQLRTGDCGERIYRTWGKYPLWVSGADIELPDLADCECVEPRTVVPSFPESRRFSDWGEPYAVCTGPESGGCH